MKNVDLKNFWMYEGSLTTPPCSEGVRWNVLSQSLPTQKKWIDNFTNNFAGNEAYAKGKGNNRVTMPINDRKIFLKGTGAV